MQSAKKYLIDTDTKLALLFTPPFDKSDLDPGYIKGYPPGLRENGGQYTHAAAWLIIARAELGDGDGAWGLLSMINPINLSATRSDCRRYKVEPYVISADASNSCSCRQAQVERQCTHKACQYLPGTYRRHG